MTPSKSEEKSLTSTNFFEKIFFPVWNKTNCYNPPSSPRNTELFILATKTSEKQWQHEQQQVDMVVEHHNDGKEQAVEKNWSKMLRYQQVIFSGLLYPIRYEMWYNVVVVVVGSGMVVVVQIWRIMVGILWFWGVCVMVVLWGCCWCDGCMMRVLVWCVMVVWWGCWWCCAEIDVMMQGY